MKRSLNSEDVEREERARGAKWEAAIDHHMERQNVVSKLILGQSALRRNAFLGRRSNNCTHLEQPLLHLRGGATGWRIQQRQGVCIQGAADVRLAERGGEALAEQLGAQDAARLQRAAGAGAAAATQRDEERGEVGDIR